MDKDNEIKWKPFQLEGKHAINDAWLNVDKFVPPSIDDWEGQDFDMVNSPAHYTSGRYEAIDVIEDAIEEAPSAKAAMLQAQVLKYLLRLWHKIDAKEDAEKARWYLTRLINSL